ncbi:MAG TPA: sugar ABC transporter permease [Arachnia sp.]|nr:sugar ABC transporter permease [Arachnia sp.]HQD20762.1 sugar ABC transporter permease [Arachnia sp.]
MTASAVTTRGGRAPAPPRERPERPRYWAYLAPMAAGFLIIVAIPLVMNVWFSLHNWQGGASEMTWVGLGNYVELMQDPTFWQSFRNTLYMIVAIVVVPTLVGLLLASVLFNLVAPRVGERTAAFLRGSYYLPQILPIAVAGFMWSWILDTDGGALNAVLTAIGVASPPDWLGSADVAIYGIMLMLIWLQLGYPVVIFMAALGRVDPSIYEAADVDGASWWSQFTRITLPELKPEIFIVTLTALVGALKVFAPILILTGGGPEGSTVVPSYYAYRNFFELSRVGYGAAISNVMALLILVIAIGMLVFQRRATDD